MRTLKFELTTAAPAKNIWPVLIDINNYHKYIKYCLRSKLKGKFQEGSYWVDWSIVMFLPLKINHKIIKVIPNKEIIYRIKFPFGNILQSIIIERSKMTKVYLEITIDLPNRLMDKTLGNIIFMRNRVMLAATVRNFKKAFPVD